MADEPNSRSVCQPVIPRFAAGFFKKLDRFDRDRLFQRLCHVVEREGRNGDSGKSLHFYARLRFGFHSRLDLKTGQIRIRHNLDFDFLKGQGMTERNQVCRLLGCHNACQSRCPQHIAFGRIARLNCAESLELHSHSPDRHRSSHRLRLGRNIDHLGLPLLIQMSQRDRSWFWLTFWLTV